MTTNSSAKQRGNAKWRNNPRNKPAIKLYATRWARTRWQERAALLRAKKAAPCADCGGRFPFYVMQFDHVRGVKLFDPSKSHGRKLEKLLAEIAKCDVVCANCHHARTWLRSHKKEGDAWILSRAS